MLEIRNISSYCVGISSSYMGAQGRPLYIKLNPGQNKQITQEELKKWGSGSKSDLASYMQRGQIEVVELTAVHIVDDLGHAPAPFGAFDLPSACNTADDIRNAYNKHIISLAVHSISDAGNLETTAKPASLVALTLFIGSLQANYNAHRVSAGVHPNNDVLNPTTLIPGTLVQNIAALQEIYSLFKMHKLQSISGIILNTNQVINY